jgi:predicted amidohydrolase YtcJ
VVEAVAIGTGRIVATGPRSDILALAGARTRRIELDPADVALPGLTDSHLHLAEAALAVDQVQLADAATLAGGLDRIRAAHSTLEPRAWLSGNGWSADRWGGWPTTAQLETVAPGRLIALWAHDHHALWVSHAALAIAGIGPASRDPAGGAIRRDAEGTPNGVLQETATTLVSALIPEPTAARYQAVIPALCRHLVELGVVAVHDPGLLRPDPRLDGPHPAYAALADAGRLPIRVYASVRAEALELAIERGLGTGSALGSDPDGPARFGWLKLFADGSLGSRTAAMLEPFEPDEVDLRPDARGPSTAGPERGIWVTEPQRLAELTARSRANGIATQIHAIGDAAVRAALDAFDQAPDARPSLPPRIEHAQLVDPADLARFGRLRIVASVQPVHLRADAGQARQAWGPRAERSAYAWRSLLAAGATLAFGTDAPVEPIDPWPGIALAITRRWPGWPADSPAFGAGQALTLDEALRAACVGPALAEGSTDRGRLTAGQRADLVVIPAAALAAPIEAGGPLASIRPRLVLVGGQVAFEA